MRWAAWLAPLVAAGCGGKHSGRAPELGVPAVPVTVEVASEANWPVVGRATGWIAARTVTMVAARIPGIVTVVHADVGTRVRLGQPLVEISARELALAVEQTDAARLEARAMLPELDHVIAGERARFALAETSHRRIAELAAKRSVTAQELDEVTARLEQARAALAAAEAKRRQIEARVSQTERAHAAARVQAERMEVVAPFDGLVTARVAHPGVVAAPGMGLLTLEKAGEYRAELAVEESLAASIRAGKPLRLSWNDGAPSVSAAVTEVEPAVNAATRTLTVRVNVPNGPLMRSGRYVEAEWTRGERRVLSIPESAVRTHGQLEFVFAAEGAAAGRRMIRLGERRGGRVEVLAGLAAGDRVVLSPALELTDGARIEVRR
ncbi:MAG: efflux RND transporter periplasmic adaptor subunit [Acidobacteria bacterium]|nr:efflux RND transporter periplasmic adaptor subunit [Acidobacteriota bacterium]